MISFDVLYRGLFSYYIIIIKSTFFFHKYDIKPHNNVFTSRNSKFSVLLSNRIIRITVINDPNDLCIINKYMSFVFSKKSIGVYCNNTELTFENINYRML